jgi:hypothetical protein
MTFREYKTDPETTTGEFEQAGKKAMVKTKLAALLYMLRQFELGLITANEFLDLGELIQRSNLKINSGDRYEVAYC